MVVFIGYTRGLVGIKSTGTTWLLFLQLIISPILSFFFCYEYLFTTLHKLAFCFPTARQ
jgi:hypothetical protein